jgi:hypothetical protein
MPQAYTMDGGGRPDLRARRGRPSDRPRVSSPTRPDPLGQRALKPGPAGGRERRCVGGVTGPCGVPCPRGLRPLHGDRPACRARAVDPPRPGLAVLPGARALHDLSWPWTSGAGARIAARHGRPPPLTGERVRVVGWGRPRADGPSGGRHRCQAGGARPRRSPAQGLSRPPTPSSAGGGRGPRPQTAPCATAPTVAYQLGPSAQTRTRTPARRADPTPGGFGGWSACGAPGGDLVIGDARAPRIPPRTGPGPRGTGGPGHPGRLFGDGRDGLRRA